MKDLDLYRHLLGIVAPWTVTEVKLDIKERRVDVWVGHPEGLTWACPECSTEAKLYDHSEEREWRHLDSCQFKTFLHARPPRVECPDHGVRQVRLPWAEPNSRFTALFERLVIDVLRETSVTGACGLLQLSWDEAWRVMENAVDRGLAVKKERAPTAIGVDEKAFAKRHQYMTLVADLDEGTVEYVAEDRTEESLDGYFEGRTPEHKAAIQAVAMDMWSPYVNSVRKHVPDAEDKIVFDKFHIMGHATKAVDMVRKQEHRVLMEMEDDTLKGTKHLWLFNEENLPVKHRDQFASLKAERLKTARAWAIKESLRDVWTYLRRGWAERWWKRWYGWASHSGLTPIRMLCKTLKRHLRQILNFIDRPVTNATLEGINSKIQTVKKRACGFRNKEHFKTAILFHCGGLDLYPVTHGDA